AVRILAGTVDVCRCDEAAVETVQMTEGVKVDFTGGLRCRVERMRIHWGVLSDGERLWQTVDGAARGGVDDLADTSGTCGLSQADSRQDIELCVVNGILDGFADIDLGCEVEDDLGAEIAHDFVNIHGEQFSHYERDLLGTIVLSQVLTATAAQVVNDENLVSLRNKKVNEVRADEAGAAGDDGTHSGLEIECGCMSHLLCRSMHP